MAAKEDVESAIKKVLMANSFAEESLANKQTIVRAVKVELDKLVKSKTIDGYLVGYGDALTVSYQKDLTITTVKASHTFEFVES